MVGKQNTIVSSDARESPLDLRADNVLHSGGQSFQVADGISFLEECIVNYGRLPLPEMSIHKIQAKVPLIWGLTPNNASRLPCASMMEASTHRLFENIDFEEKISLVELLWRGIRRAGNAKATRAMSTKPRVPFRGIKLLNPKGFETSLEHYREAKAKEMLSIFKRIFREESDQAKAEISKLCATLLTEFDTLRNNSVCKDGRKLEKFRTTEGSNPMIANCSGLVEVLKTTKFVNVANLADYLSSMSGPNCRVVVQQVEQGSAIAKQLDRALEDMQRRKLATANGESQLPSGDPQHAVAPSNTPTRNEQVIGQGQTVTSPTVQQQKPQQVQPDEGHHATAVLHQGYVADIRSASGCTATLFQRSCEAFSSTRMTEPVASPEGDLEQRVSSLLMQLKQVSLVPRNTAGGSGAEHGHQTTIDTCTSFPDNGRPGLPKDSNAQTEKEMSECSTMKSDLFPEATNHTVDTVPFGMQSVKCHDIHYPEQRFGDYSVEQIMQNPCFGRCEESEQHKVDAGHATFPQQVSLYNLMEHFVPQDGSYGFAEANHIGPEAYPSEIGESKLVRRFTPRMGYAPHPVAKAAEQVDPNNVIANNTPTTPSPKTTGPSPGFMTTVQTPRATPKCQTGPRRKAVVVGCSYMGDADASLRGPCNDAMLFASALVTHMGFDVDDILLLIDSEPANVYVQQLVTLASSQKPVTPVRCNTTERQKTGVIGGMLGGLIGDLLHGVKADSDLDVPEMLMLDSPGEPIPADNRPTRSNILKALRWMVSGMRPGDCGVFYFSGHAVQTDDMSGWEGEGYDEALVPCDYMYYGDPSRGLIPAQQIRQLIQSVGRSCQMTVVLDTVGMQTALDPAGRSGPWRYIKGAMLRGMWPLADATGKMQRAVYDPAIWQDVSMQQQLVRPKFLPMLQVDCAAALIDGFISSNTEDKSSNIICIAAAPFQDVAVETLFCPLSLTDTPIVRVTQQGCEQVVCHGVFTYCLVATLLRDRTSKRGGITVRELVSGVNKRCQYLRSTRLPKLQQLCEATIHPAGLASLDNFFLAPWGGRILPEYGRRLNRENVYKRLSAGLGSFLTLPEAWMQLHNEGRMRAAEQREKFGRMRSAVVNGTRMVTADLRQMMLKQQQQQQGYVYRGPTSSLMFGHVPQQQLSAAGQSWFGHSPIPQAHQSFTPPGFMTPHHGVFPTEQQMGSPMAAIQPNNYYQPMAQDYIVEPNGMMYPAQQYVPQWEGEYYLAEPAPQFGSCPQQPFLRYVPPQEEQNVQPRGQSHQFRSMTSSMLNRTCNSHPGALRHNTGSLLNSVFGLDFDVMNTKLGHSQTTKGLWGALVLPKDEDHENATLVIDVEGTDSRERGDGRLTFEHRSALLCLAISDCVIVNLWYHSLGNLTGSNYGLLKTVVEANLELAEASENTLGSGDYKTVLCFCIRDWFPELAPLETVRHKVVKEYMMGIWNDINKPDRFKDADLEDVFRFELFGFNHALVHQDEFTADAQRFRKEWLTSIRPKSYSRAVPSDGFFYYAGNILNTVKEQSHLDIPNQREMLANFRCQEIKTAVLEEMSPMVTAMLTDAHNGSLGDFKERITALADEAVEKYLELASRYDKATSTKIGNELISSLFQKVQPVFDAVISHHCSDLAVTATVKMNERFAITGKDRSLLVGGQKATDVWPRFTSLCDEIRSELWYSLSAQMKEYAVSYSSPSGISASSAFDSSTATDMFNVTFRNEVEVVRGRHLQALRGQIADLVNIGFKVIGESLLDRDLTSEKYWGDVNALIERAYQTSTDALRECYSGLVSSVQENEFEYLSFIVLLEAATANLERTESRIADIIVERFEQFFQYQDFNGDVIPRDWESVSEDELKQTYSQCKKDALNIVAVLRDCRPPTLEVPHFDISVLKPNHVLYQEFSLGISGLNSDASSLSDDVLVDTVKACKKRFHELFRTAQQIQNSSRNGVSWRNIPPIFWLVLLVCSWNELCGLLRIVFKVQVLIPLLILAFVAVQYFSHAIFGASADAMSQITASKTGKRGRRDSDSEDSESDIPSQRQADGLGGKRRDPLDLRVAIENDFVDRDA
ncbi:Protein SEY1 -like protein [Babesia sp. Xinjiang]|uniref:Protein SEY1 -like protein n=1 Tax=Babesia sp. Xinjiang TaxID=462227 RepID=UPI000A241BC2|nr:Protein SEY1 -like protein [Babesia sp. Xinjiang]ORM41512.1 Protein SEY1 -like protein [Babesia sp. Xinjiang]